jgi:hypothetical protein
MTMIHFVLIASHVAALGAGYYAHHRWGTTLAADAAKVKSVV